MVSEKYLKLLDYISYFEHEHLNFCTWHQTSQMNDDEIELGYPVYDERLRSFIQDVYDSDLLMNDYFNYLKQHQVDPTRMKESIAEADFELLRAILTYSVRGERFCDGFWERMLKEKIFLNILYRLRALSG